MVISGFPALKDSLRHLPPKAAVVAAAHDEHTLQAVFAARRDGLIRPILVGRREEILSIARGMGEELDPSQVADAGEDPVRGLCSSRGCSPRAPCSRRW